MTIEWNRVTWYSKTLALFVFVVVSFAGFFIGIEYGKSVAHLEDAAKIAACQQPLGGTNVDGPHIAPGGGHCGGNMLNPFTCSVGYHCAPAPGLPFGDVGGICTPD